MSTTEGVILAVHDEFLVVNALRYARTRGPGVLDYTCFWIVEHWHQLSGNTRSVIARDVALEVELRSEEPPEETAHRRRDTPHWEALLDTIEGDTPCSKP